MNTFDSSKHPREGSGKFTEAQHHEDPTLVLAGGQDFEAMSSNAAQAVYGAMCDESVTVEDDGAGIQLVIGNYEGEALTASCSAGRWQCFLGGRQYLEHSTLGADGDPGEVAQWLYEVREELGVSQPEYRAAW